MTDCACGAEYYRTLDEQGNGSMFCVKCPAGRYGESNATKTAPENCTACPVGKFGTVPGQITEVAARTPCPPGTFTEPNIPGSSWDSVSPGQANEADGCPIQCEKTERCGLGGVCLPAYGGEQCTACCSTEKQQYSKNTLEVHKQYGDALFAHCVATFYLMNDECHECSTGLPWGPIVAGILLLVAGIGALWRMEQFGRWEQLAAVKQAISYSQPVEVLRNT